jgi:hypothetical protein
MRRYTPSFDSTTNRLLGIKPVTLKLKRIFAFKNAFSNVSLRGCDKGFLVNLANIVKH